MRFSKRTRSLRLALGAIACAGAVSAWGCAPGGYYHTSQSALDSLLTSQAELSRRITALEKKLDVTRETVQASRAEGDTRYRDLSQRLEVLDGKLEESGARVSLLSQRMETVKRRMNADSTGRGVRDTTASLDPEAMYQAAYSDVAAGRYNLAKESFQTYLQHFPDSDVADNAQYWIGECDYGTGDFAGAITEFQKVIDNYPKGDKVPAAMFKIGISYSRLKNMNEANKYYRMVVQKYPKSPEAALAKERLGTKS